MCRMSWNLGTSPSWNPQGLSRPVMGLLYLYLLDQSNPINLPLNPNCIEGIVYRLVRNNGGVSILPPCLVSGAGSCFVACIIICCKAPCTWYTMKVKIHAFATSTVILRAHGSRIVSWLKISCFSFSAVQRHETCWQQYCCCLQFAFQTGSLELQR